MPSSSNVHLLFVLTFATALLLLLCYCTVICRDTRVPCMGPRTPASTGAELVEWRVAAEYAGALRIDETPS